MKGKEVAFIDPSPVTPRELRDAEMAALSGGAIPLTVVIWATECGYPFTIGFVGVASTIIT